MKDHTSKHVPRHQFPEAASIAQPRDLGSMDGTSASIQS